MSSYSEVSLSAAITNAIRNGKAIVHDAPYPAWARDMNIRQNPSDNHWTFGKIADEVNWMNGKPTVLLPYAIVDKAARHVEGTTLDLRELYERGAYLLWNLEGYRTTREVMRYMGKEDVANLCHKRLRAIASTLALTAYPVTPRSMTAAELVHYGPALVVADGPPKATVVLPPAVSGGVRKKFEFDYTGLMSTACCGVRSANTKQQGTAGREPDLAKDGPPAWRDLPGEGISNLVMDMLLGRLDSRGKALADRGLMGHWLSDAEEEILFAASHNFEDGINQAIEWIKDGLPRNPFRIIRAQNAVGMFCLSAPGAPTATLYMTLVDTRTGKHYFLMADPGDRHNIKSGVCTVSVIGSSLSASVLRADGLSAELPPIDIGQILADLEFGGADSRFILRTGGSTLPPVVPPVSPPPVEERKKSWWTRFLEFLGIK